MAHILTISELSNNHTICLMFATIKRTFDGGNLSSTADAIFDGFVLAT